MSSIPHDELKRIIEENEDRLVIDVRPREHYERGHIPGSISIPVTSPAFAEQVDRQVADRSTPVILYDDQDDGPAVRSAIRALASSGLMQVQALAGGLSRWMHEGHPLVSGAAAL